jgi:hypothetical protein
MILKCNNCDGCTFTLAREIISTRKGIGNSVIVSEVSSDVNVYCNKCDSLVYSGQLDIDILQELIKI